MSRDPDSLDPAMPKEPAGAEPFEEMPGGLRRLARYAIDQAADAIYWIDRGGRFVFVNEAACEALGYTRDELLGMRVPDIDPNYTAADWPDQWGALRRKGAVAFESLHRRKDGRFVPVEIRANFLALEGREYNVAFARDISERKEAEAELRYRQGVERLISTIAARFINLETGEIQRGLEQALGEIGEFTGVDRAQIFLLSEDGDHMECVVEWAAEGVPRHIHRLQRVPRDVAPWFFERLRTSGVSSISSLNDVPADQTEMLELLRAAGTVSLIDVPILRSGRLAGFLGLASVSEEREWDDSTIGLLKITSEIMANTLERRDIESAFRESRERLELALDGAELGMWDWFPRTGRIVRNARLADLLGYADADADSGLEFFKGRLHPEDVEPTMTALGDHLEERRPSFDAEYRVRAADGDYIWLQDRGKITERDREGRPVRVTGVTQDITRRKRAEQQHTRLSTAIEQAAESVMLTDTEGTIQYVNPAFERTTGRSRASAVGRDHRLLTAGHQDSGALTAIRDAIRRGTIWSGRISSRNKDGKRVEQEATVSPIHEAGGSVIGYVWLLHDVTEQVQLESLLRQSQKMEAVGQLAGGVAHDFNNLLQVIQGYTELAHAGLSESEPARVQLEQVMESTEQAASLVRQLLTFSRREQFRPERVNLDETILAVMKMLGRVLGEQIDLDARSRGGPKIVHADAGQIQQILMNLCVNARDAMPDGGKITIACEEVVFDSEFVAGHPWARPGRFASLSVSDTGTGIGPELRERVFEPFFTTKEVGRGTGLGLATVYAVTRRHDGLVRVESEPGKGSTFRIFLPVHDDDTADLEQQDRQPLPKGNGETILFAEDDETVRGWVLRVLEAAGYKVLAARDGEEAINLFERNRSGIDLALLDVVMPRQSGRDVYRAIRSLRPDLPVLFTSGYSYDVLEHGGLPDREASVLRKPFNARDVLRRAREALDGS